MTHSSFTNDLKLGQDIETRVIETLTTVERPQGKFEDYDFKLGGLFCYEVKYDKYPSQNFAFEYWKPKTDTPSGINATKADFWIQVYDEPNSKQIAVIFQTKLMIEEIRKYNTGGCNPSAPSIVKNIECAGNGNASIHLINKQFVLDNFKSIIKIMEIK